MHANFGLAESTETSIKNTSNGKRFVFIYKFANGECGEMHRGSFKFSEYPQGEQKNNTKGKTGESR